MPMTGHARLVRAGPAAPLAALHADEDGAAPPLPVALGTAARASMLADGRELIDGIASWWTAVPRLQPSAYPSGAVAQQARACRMSCSAGSSHEQALTLAQRLAAHAAGRSRPRVLLGLRLGRGRGRDEDGDAVLAQPGHPRPHDASSPSAAAITATPSRTMAVCDPDEGMHALFAGLPAAADRRRSAARRSAASPRSMRFSSGTQPSIAGIIVEPLVQGAGGMMFHDAEVLRRVARRAPTNTICF